METSTFSIFPRRLDVINPLQRLTLTVWPRFQLIFHFISDLPRCSWWCLITYHQSGVFLGGQQWWCNGVDELIWPGLTSWAHRRYLDTCKHVGKRVMSPANIWIYLLLVCQRAAAGINHPHGSSWFDGFASPGCLLTSGDPGWLRATTGTCVSEHSNICCPAIWQEICKQTTWQRWTEEIDCCHLSSCFPRNVTQTSVKNILLGFIKLSECCLLNAFIFQSLLVMHTWTKLFLPLC